MPGLVKIGMTKDQPGKRASALSNTSVPLPFVVEYSSFVPDPIKSERYLHELFDSNRVAANREFFEVSTKEAIRKTEASIPNLKRGQYKPPRTGLKLFFFSFTFALLGFVIYKSGYLPQMNRLVDSAFTSIGRLIESDK